MRVVQAFDGALIEDIAVDDAVSLDRKLSLAQRTFWDRAEWLPAHERIAVLQRLARLVEREADAFAVLIAREGGKPIVDARVEVARAVNGIRGAVGSLEAMAGREIPMGLTPASENRIAFTTREPIGVVAALSAFNHPLNLIVHQVVPAIAVGCPVVVKPAEATPLCCLRFVELVREAGLPEAWCQTLVVDDLSLAERFATDARVNLVSFIGSAKVGWYLRSKIAPGTRIMLEHGGAAPVIVDETARLDEVIGPLLKGAYYHAGQVCLSVQRVFVHEAVKAEFVTRFAEGVRELRCGDPCEDATEVGPLIRVKEVDRVLDWCAQAVAGGAAVAAGGSRISERMMEPTLLLEPAADALVSTAEVFGPLACVYGYERIEEAVARANALPWAFQAAIFTQDIDHALRAARGFDASAVMINDHTAFRTDWMPFAGRRQSGLGVGGFPATMQEMTEEKMIVVKLR